MVRMTGFSWTEEKKQVLAYAVCFCVCVPRFEFRYLRREVTVHFVDISEIHC